MKHGACRMQSDDLERFARLFVDASEGRNPSGIAIRIQQVIAAGDVQVGERLPNERDLGHLFGVSRATMREALRILEAEGLVEVRRGVTGGAFVSRPGGDRAGSALAALIRFGQATPEHFAEFRLHFEAETARLAALRAPSEQAALLLETAAQVGLAAQSDVSWEEFMDRDIAFHEQVAEASMNPIRMAVMLGVHAAFRQSSLRLSATDTPQWRAAQAAQLLEIARAIRMHKPQLAERLMQEHLTINTAVAAEMLSAPPLH